MKPQLSVILPSYAFHASCCHDLLRSVQRFAYDKEVVQFRLIISSGDEPAFANIIRDTGDLNVTTTTLTKLLAAYSIVLEDEADALKAWGKFTYQSLKKLLGVLSASSHWSLLMDSEGVFCRPFRFTDLVKHYAKHRQVFYSNYVGTPLQHDVNASVSDLLHSQIGDRWLFDQTNWFLEKPVLQDLVVSFGGMRGFYDSLTTKQAMFEMVLYYWWVWLNNNRYKYRFLPFADELSRYLPIEQQDQLLNAVRKHNLTPGEFVALGLNYDNIGHVSRFFRDFNLSFFRPIEDPRLKAVQQDFIRQTPSIKVLTCSGEACQFMNSM